MRATKFEERRGARQAALQILYQWEAGGAPIDDTLAAYWAAREQDDADGEAAPTDREYAAQLARGTVERVSELDIAIEAQAEHWRLARMAVIDRLILRLAAYELTLAGGAPAAVVINEAAELARRFSEEAAIRFVNGILDGLARSQNRSTHD